MTLFCLLSRRNQQIIRRKTQTPHRVVNKERDKMKGRTKQKMARGHSKEGGNHLEQKILDRRQWKTLMEGYTSCSGWTKPRSKVNV